LWLLSIVLLATKFESPVCEGGLMGSRFKDRELGAIEAEVVGIFFTTNGLVDRTRNFKSNARQFKQNNMKKMRRRPDFV